MTDLLSEFAALLIRREGPRGRQWLAALPGLIDSLCARWHLVRDGAPMHGGLGIVLPVRRGSQGYVLKLVYEAGEAEHAALALRAWNGEGAVRLYEADAGSGALLLERLDPRRTTASLPTAEALAVAAGLLLRLGIAAPAAMPSLREHASRFIEEAPRRWRRAGRPLPEARLEEALAIAARLGPASGGHLVHWDLHDGNILAGEREPWLAIDPRILAGDLEFGIAQLLWRRLDALPGPAALDAAIAALCAGAGLDRAKARLWTRFRCVDYWLWGVAAGLTRDPERCGTILDWTDEGGSR